MHRRESIAPLLMHREGGREGGRERERERRGGRERERERERVCMLFSQFVMFSEREEQTTPYHRQYDFFIHRFAAMSLLNNAESPQTLQQ